MVRSTTVELESVHAEPLNSKNTISLAEARKLDLETAVLMQVQINLLKLENYLLEKYCFAFVKYREICFTTISKSRAFSRNNLEL